jgi:hypothetical protein
MADNVASCSCRRCFARTSAALVILIIRNKPIKPAQLWQSFVIHSMTSWSGGASIIQWLLSLDIQFHGLNEFSSISRMNSSLSTNTYFMTLPSCVASIIHWLPAQFWQSLIIHSMTSLRRRINRPFVPARLCQSFIQSLDDVAIRRCIYRSERTSEALVIMLAITYYSFDDVSKAAHQSSIRSSTALSIIYSITQWRRD